VGRNRQREPEYGTFTVIDNLNVHVWLAGTGPPIVLIHGFMGMAYDWRSNIQELGQYLSVCALDLPGFGYTDKPLNFDYSSNGYAEFIASFLNTYNIDRVVLVGNSMGGQIALMTCLNHPDRVAGLILIDSGGYPRSVQFLPFRLLSIPVIGRISMEFVNRAVIRMMLRKGIYFNGSLATDEVIDNYYAVYDTVNARKMPPVIMRIIINDEAYIASNLHKIKCPTLIIWGDEDRVISPSRAEMFQRDIRGASLVMVPQVGHMPQVEKAEMVNEAIIDFASKVIKA
jgi:pimeloyl-ACP methyl ester carboxylesterase